MPVRKEVNKDFFKHPTSEMVYVLGFFVADGNLVVNKRGAYYLSFYSADKEILFKIKKVMNSEHKLAKRSVRSGGVFRLQIGSKEMVTDLLNLGLDTKKTKRIRIPCIPQVLIMDFIRGYFDGDGNVWAGFINKSRTKPTRVLQVAFTSGCRAFLEELLVISRQHGIKGGSIFKVKGLSCWRLSFSTLDALKLHKIMYNVPSKLRLERKKLVFDKYIENAAVV